MITGTDLDIGDPIAFRATGGKWELGVVHNLSMKSVVIATKNEITDGEMYTAFAFADLTIHKTHVDCASCGRDKQSIEDYHVEKPRDHIDVLIEAECYLCNAL